MPGIWLAQVYLLSKAKKTLGVTESLGHKCHSQLLASLSHHIPPGLVEGIPDCPCASFVLMGPFCPATLALLALCCRSSPSEVPVDSLRAEATSLVSVWLGVNVVGS